MTPDSIKTQIIEAFAQFDITVTNYSHEEDDIYVRSGNMYFHCELASNDDGFFWFHRYSNEHATTSIGYIAIPYPES